MANLVVDARSPMSVHELVVGSCFFFNAFCNLITCVLSGASDGFGAAASFQQYRTSAMQVASPVFQACGDEVSSSESCTAPLLGTSASIHVIQLLTSAATYELYFGLSCLHWAANITSTNGLDLQA